MRNQGETGEAGRAGWGRAADLFDSFSFACAAICALRRSVALSTPAVTSVVFLGINEWLTRPANSIESGRMSYSSFLKVDGMLYTRRDVFPICSFCRTASGPGARVG